MFHLVSEPHLQNGIDLGNQLDVVRHDASSDTIQIPNADLMFSGEYHRAGTDLVLSSPDGEHFTVHDYFRGEKRPTLSSPNGATLSGDIVEALTGHGSYAQAATSANDAPPQAIGKVASVQGGATAIRNGVAVTLNVGDAVYKGDVLQTAGGSALGVVFVDGTTFNLSANARMVMNEFVYDPNGTSNAAAISLVQGAITFLAGQIAHTGDMKVATPVATMGIRGTAVNVNISADNGATNISVMAEADNITHTVQVYALPTQDDLAAGKTVGALLGVVTNNSGVFTFNPTPTGVIVQETSKDVATVQKEMAIVQQVFQTQAIGQQFLQGPDQSNTKTAQNATGTQFVVSDHSTTHTAGTTDNTTGPTVTKVDIGPESTGTTTQSGPVHINTAPVAHADTADVVESGVKAGNVTFAGTPTASGNVIANDTDLDPQDVQTVVSVSPVSAHLHGTLSLGGDGHYTYTLDNDSPLTQQLAVGETAQDVFTYTISDLGGLTSTSTLTVTVTGTDDVPVVAVADKVQAAAITELVLTTGSAVPDVRSGTIHFTDVDLSDRPTATVSDQAISYLAADGHTVLTLTADETAALKAAFSIAAETNTNNGSIDWTYSIQDKELDFLANGETVTLTSTVLVDDHHGGTDTATVTITLTGTDDVPVVGGVPIIFPTDKFETGTVAELSNTTGSSANDQAAGGVIRFSDVDLSDRPTATIDFQAAIYRAADGSPMPPLSAAQLAAIVAGFTISAPTLSVAAAPAGASAVNNFGSSSNTNSGEIDWAYNIADSSLDFLAAGETVELKSVILLDDHNGGTDTALVAVTITGTNDAPVVATADVTGGVTEQTSAPAGNLTDGGTIAFTDVDLTDHHSIQPTIVASNGALGSLTASVTGDTTGTGQGGVISWNYSVADSAVEYLAKDQTKVEHFTITLDDGNGGQIARTIDVTITGTNDAPVVATADVTGGVTEQTSAPAGNLTDGGTIAFTDVDLTDHHSIQPTIVASNGALGSLTASVTGDTTGTGQGGVISWNYSVADSAVEYLAKDQTKVEHFTITLDDGNGGQIARTIDVTITGTNDAPVVATADVTGGVTEQTSAPAGNLTDGGTIAFTDVDLTDHHSIQPTIVASNGALGSLTASVTGDTTGTGQGGVISWNYSVADSAVEYLAKDQTKVEHFTITLDDGNGGQIARTIDVTITGTNDAPVANDDVATTTFGNSISVGPVHGLLANDTDVDTTDNLTVSQINGINLVPSQSVTLAHGTLTAAADGSYTFNPAPGFSGVQNFDYTVSDGHGGSDVGSDAITVGALVANVQNFDTLAANEAAVPNGYGGFTWSNFDVLSGTPGRGGANGYTHGMVSAPNVAYNGFGGTASVSGSEFNFVGADLTAAWDTGLHVQVQGFFHGAQLYSTDVVINNTAATWFDFNFNGVDQVTFTSSGGFDASAADGGSGTQFAMDNFAWNPAAVLTADPIIVDLGTPGISLTSATASPVSFDLNADGIKEQVGWTSGADGILVSDLDHSGAIENGHEVFSPAFGQGGFATALDALRSYDSNGDGILDQRDAAFSDVFVWQDSNHDGITDQGELAGLLDNGIASIDLNATPTQSEINGQQVVAEGQMTMTDGTTGQYLAVNLQSAPVLPVIANQGGSTAGFASPVFNGGPGNDVYVATTDQDTFVFKIGGGHDTIVGFDTSASHPDFIDVSGLGASGQNILALLDSAQDTAQGTLFTVGDDSLLVQDVHKQALTADHFIGVASA